MEQIRSFIAIELPAEVKSGLKNVQGLLKSDNPRTARWVDPDSIHLTLKFLGNVPADKISIITQSIQTAVQGISPFSLEVKGLGAFPGLTRPQVVWIGLTGGLADLQTLQKNLESLIAPLGFPTENRPFTAHLTLARLRDTATSLERQKLGELIAHTVPPAGLALKVDSISLMRSQLTPSGAVYTRLAEVPLYPLAK
jgi:RNA 2',3'-cyclic 3'-phosphodiesterase